MRERLTSPVRPARAARTGAPGSDRTARLGALDRPWGRVRPRGKAPPTFTAAQVAERLALHRLANLPRVELLRFPSTDGCNAVIDPQSAPVS